MSPLIHQGRQNMASLLIPNRHASSLFTTVALLLSATTARAEVIDIAWDASGRFERVLDLAPVKFAEVCARLTKGQSIAWSFKSGQPLNFNVRHHAEKAGCSR